MKVLLVVGDGMADRGVPELGLRTPLEVAFKPTMDGLAVKGAQGLMDVIFPGVRPGSDTAHLALFGYDPHKYYTGRGAFEALGVGAELEHGDIAFRGNFATVDDNLIVIDRRAGRKVPEAEELVKALNDEIGEIDGVEVRFYHATEHRLAVVLHGEGLSPKVTDTDPHKTGVKVATSVPLEDTPEARRTAEIVNKITMKSYEVLKDHPANKERVKQGLPPANIVLLRGAGVMPHIPPFEAVFHVKAAAVSATALILGVCRALGFKTVTPPGATGGVDTSVEAKAKAAVDLLRSGFDLVYVHVKGTDAASHDRNPYLKAYMIERIDKMLSLILDEYGRDDLVVAVTADHATPIVTADHSGDPVPLLLWYPGARPDATKRFCEAEAVRGALHRIKGVDLVNVLLQLAGLSEKYGA